MKRHDHEKMLILYQQWQASGKSKTEFAAVHGVRPTTFYYWAREFEQAESGSSLGFLPITIEEPLNKKPGELMVAVEYPSGVRLELYSCFQEVRRSYAQLLKTLME